MKTPTTRLLYSSPGIQTKDGARERKTKDSRTVPWTSEEDQTIKEIVKKHGPRRWAFVASQLPGRRSKQCRERWHNQLDPMINKHSWIDEEEWLLFLLQRQQGSRWARIAQVLQGRTDNSIKNHWNGRMKKKKIDFTFLFNRISSDAGHYYPGHVCPSDTPLQDGVESCSALLQRLIKEAVCALKAKQSELDWSQKRLHLDEDKENLMSLALQKRSSKTGLSPLEASTGCIGNEGSVLRDISFVMSNCKLKSDGFFETYSPLVLNPRRLLLAKESPCRRLDLNSQLEYDWQIDTASLGSDIDLSSILGE
jgi:hypothetical protein